MKISTLKLTAVTAAAFLVVAVPAAYATLTTGALTVTTDGNYTLDGVAGSVYSFGPSTTTGSITIGGTAQTGNINIGSSAKQLVVSGATGATTVQAGGLTVAAGGATITGASTITGTLGGLTGLTVASGGANITGASTITGNLTIAGTSNILVPATYGLDTSAAGALNIGATTATGITVGRTGQTVTFPGNVTVTGTFSPSITSLPSLTLSNTTNQLVLGTTNTVTINSVAPAASRTYVIPDNATAGVNFVLAPTSTTTTQALFATATGGAPAFRALSLTDLPAQTGTGSIVLATSPTLTTPVLGVATATSLNGNTFTAGTYTLTGAAAKTLTFNNSLTLAGTDATTMTFPSTSATIARTDAGQTFTGAQTINGNLTLGPATSHVISTQTTIPTTTAVTYTAGTVLAGSTDTKGQFTVTTTAATGSATLVFNAAYASAPICTVSPASANAQADASKTYVTSATTGLTINYAVAPTANLQTWNYICAQ